MCTCDEILDLLSARLDGVLTGEEERLLAEHLDACPACRALAEDLAHLHALLPGLNEEPPAFIKEKVMARIREEGAAPIPFPALKRRPNRWRAWAGAAAVFAVVLLGVYALRGAAGKGDYGAAMMAKPAAAPSAEKREDAPTQSSAAADAQTTEVPVAGAQGYCGLSRTAGEESSVQNDGGAAPPAPQSAETVAPSAPPQASLPAGGGDAAVSPAPQSAEGSGAITTAAPPLKAFLFTIAPEPGPSVAGARLYDELLRADHPDAEWTEGEDFTGYLLPGGDWRMEYLGLSEDGLDYLFHAYAKGEAGSWYAVPADGGAIRPCDPIPAQP